MVPGKPDEKSTVRGSVSSVPAILAALHTVPRIASAVVGLVHVALDEAAGSEPGLRDAAVEAVSRFLSTLQRILPPAEEPVRSGPEPESLAGFNAGAVLREHYGFVPRLFQAQKAWPELVAAEVRLLEQVVFEEAALTRAEKECLLLACAMADVDKYGCALHFGILQVLGEQAEATRILGSEGAGEGLLEALAWASSAPGVEHAARAYKEVLACGFTEPQALEAAAVCAVGQLLHGLEKHLHPAADFALPSFPKKFLYPSAAEVRPTAEQPVRDDPDAEVVARVKKGDTEAFADLIRQHSRKVFGTLLGLLGDAEEARDVSQEAFLKAFQNLQRFEGRAKFSSWLMSIAINTGTEVLRKRRNFESIDTGDDDDEWRPRQIQEWSDNPEECFAKEEMKDLVRRGVMRLPSKYRVALLVRDVSQLSTEDAADALGLSVPALKARVLRGRLMLREALAPHFVSVGERGAHG